MTLNVEDMNYAKFMETFSTNLVVAHLDGVVLRVEVDDLTRDGVADAGVEPHCIALEKTVRIGGEGGREELTLRKTEPSMAANPLMEWRAGGRGSDGTTSLFTRKHRRTIGGQ